MGPNPGDRRRDLTSMGVEVPPGRHRLALRHRNPFIAASLLISGCTLVVLLVVAAGRQPHISRG